jgi:hypothetical protein
MGGSREDGCRVAVGLAAGLLLAGSARGQLMPEQVLVIYDSRIADSLAVAEYYAGSAQVAGGAGNLAGVRPGVRVVDLAAIGAGVTGPANISYTDFQSRLRVPIKNYLASRGLTRVVRCLVLTKGLPHRMMDSDNPFVGDFPANFVNEFLANDANMASVDSELTLLQQDLSQGENGAGADSKSDGVVLNPYWRSSTPISLISTANITAAKSYSVSSPGPVYATNGSGASRLTAGDIYLVCRLDGNTVADVRAMIDRAQGVVLDTAGAAVVLDESDSDGVSNTSGNDEFDNSSSAMGALRAGDDYEQTRDRLVSVPVASMPAFGNVRYNGLRGVDQFFVGPRLDFQPGNGILVGEPVVLIASYGANHAGVPTLADGSSAGTTYATSFHLARGCVFNTIESFNGRGFGGLGQVSFAPQQQAADFIAAGGTFALANVWEPLADSVPDNFYVVQNFLGGTMSWAEAAWTAIPALSWQQIVLGDPLARVARASEDANQDGVFDVEDLYTWEQNPTAINAIPPVDAADRAILVRTLRAAERFELVSGR